MSEKLREALRELIACYEEASDNMSKAERTHHRKVLASARAALSEEAPAADAQAKTLTDEQIDRIAENCAKGMPDGIQGFCKTWGWRQFARELLDVCAGYERAASRPLPAIESEAGRQDAAKVSANPSATAPSERDQPADQSQAKQQHEHTNDLHTGNAAQGNQLWPAGRTMGSGPADVLAEAIAEQADQMRLDGVHRAMGRVAMGGAVEAAAAQSQAKQHTENSVFQGMPPGTRVDVVRWPDLDEPAKQAEYPPLPTKRRAMFCTKCGYSGETTEPLGPGGGVLCGNPKCGYLAFGQELNYSDDEMRAYVDADRAARAGFVLVPQDPPNEMLRPFVGSNMTHGEAWAAWQEALAARPRGAGD